MIQVKHALSPANTIIHIPYQDARHYQIWYTISHTNDHTQNIMSRNSIYPNQTAHISNNKSEDQDQEQIENYSTKKRFDYHCDMISTTRETVKVGRLIKNCPTKLMP